MVKKRLPPPGLPAWSSLSEALRRMTVRRQALSIFSLSVDLQWLIPRHRNITQVIIFKLNTPIDATKAVQWPDHTERRRTRRGQTHLLLDLIVRFGQRWHWRVVWLHTLSWKNQNYFNFYARPETVRKTCCAAAREEHPADRLYH